MNTKSWTFAPLPNNMCNTFKTKQTSLAERFYI